MAEHDHDDVGFIDDGRKARDYDNDLDHIGENDTVTLNIDTKY